MGHTPTTHLLIIPSYRNEAGDRPLLGSYVQKHFAAWSENFKPSLWASSKVGEVLVEPEQSKWPSGGGVRSLSLLLFLRRRPEQELNCTKYRYKG